MAEDRWFVVTVIGLGGLVVMMAAEVIFWP